MILLYSPQLTSRLKFVLDTFLTDLAGFDYQFTDQQELLTAHEGPKLNYSAEYIDGELFIQSDSLLFQMEISQDEPPVGHGKNGKIIFPVTDPKACLDFDPFAAAFYLLSLYDEYLPKPADRHGRISPESTFVFRHGFVNEPFVEQWAQQLATVILEKYPRLPRKSRCFRFQPTFDIDQAWAYRHKGFWRNAGGLLRDLFHGNISGLTERLGVVLRLRPDPFDTYDYLLNLHDKAGLMPLFFILCGRYGPYDKNIDIHHPDFRALIRKLDCRARCGLHPSYNTYLAPELLSNEVNELSQALEGPITLSRQHYLRFKVPDTFRHLISVGITDDYSLGFAGAAGFRAGTSSAFPFYDLEKDEVTTLNLHPVSYMDGTLRDYLGLTPIEAAKTIAALISKVKQVNGTFIPLWHNESLGESGRWKGWRKVYESMLDAAAPYKST